MSTGHSVRTRVRLSGQDTLSLYRECPSVVSGISLTLYVGAR
jgi:hypothetical protein